MAGSSLTLCHNTGFSVQRFNGHVQKRPFLACLKVE